VAAAVGGHARNAATASPGEAAAPQTRAAERAAGSA